MKPLNQFQLFTEALQILDDEEYPKNAVKPLCNWAAQSIKATIAGMQIHNPDGFVWKEKVVVNRATYIPDWWERAFPYGRSRWFFDGGRPYIETIGPVLDTIAKIWLYREKNIDNIPHWYQSIRQNFNTQDACVAINPNSRKMMKEAEKNFISLDPILLIGENGCGKTYLAKLIHQNSLHPDAPFSIPGDFASHGTFYVKDWHLQSRNTRISYMKRKKRLIASTSLNHKTEQLIKEWTKHTNGTGSIIKVPALRDRQEDIPQMSSLFLKIFSHIMGRSVPGISSRAIELLQSYSWSGNIIELQNILKTSLEQLFADEQVIYVYHLPASIRGVQFTEDTENLEHKMELSHIAEIEKTRNMSERKKQKAHGTRTAEALG